MNNKKPLARHKPGVPFNPECKTLTPAAARSMASDRVNNGALRRTVYVGNRDVESAEVDIEIKDREGRRSRARVLFKWPRRTGPPA